MSAVRRRRWGGVAHSYEMTLPRNEQSVLPTWEGRFVESVTSRLEVVVRGPEVRIGYIRQRSPCRGWDLGQTVYSLRTVVVSEKIVSGGVKRRVLLQVICPI